MSSRKKSAKVAMPSPPDGVVQEMDFEPDVARGEHMSEGLSTPQLEAQPGRATTNGYGSVTPATQQQLDRVAETLAPKKSSARAVAPDLLRGLLMLLMALDHNVLSLSAWPQGVVKDGHELAGTVVREWNIPLGYTTRSLSHLCAPGFTFLLGMGVAYFGRSRTNLGWSSARMARHFVLRALVLTAIVVLMGAGFTAGRIWFLNVVLFSLAVDYLLVGLLWLTILRTEKALAQGLLRLLPDAKQDDAREPLLPPQTEPTLGIAPDRKIIRVADISWHTHNVVLFLLAIVTIWWNIWLSPTGGYCGVEAHDKFPRWVQENDWLLLFFYVIEKPPIMSVFPPFAWLSFAILGLLYGRIMLAKSWSTGQIIAVNTLAGTSFLVVFALTRVFRLGNLSENCLQMPEHLANPDKNPYLVSAASFFYTIKYPPDVAYWAATIGVNLLLLALFTTVPPRIANKWGKPLLVFGTSALFFYVVHQPILFGLGAVMKSWLGHPTGVKDPFTGEETPGIDNLFIFFGYYLLVMAVMYFFCKKYGVFKGRRGADSIWRFF